MINVYLQEKHNIDISMNFNNIFHPHDKKLDKYTRNERNFFINKIDDPLSIEILSHSNPMHLKVLMRDVKDPIYNHSIHNFVSKKRPL